jgi:hypothetical protein
LGASVRWSGLEAHNNVEDRTKMVRDSGGF